MREEKPCVCRALSNSRRDSIFPSNSTALSSFISISIPQPKIRIKIPKLLAKTLPRRKNHQKCDETDGDGSNETKKNKGKWGKPGNLFPKKVGSFVSNVFGSKKSQEKSFSTGETEAEGSKKDGKLSFSGISNKRHGFGFDVKGKQAASCNLSRVSSKKIRRGERSTGKKGVGDGGKENGGGVEEEEELCKKRILMGEKCRTLNLSGALHYDNNGVLLPEE